MYNFKSLQQGHSRQASQNGRFALLEITSLGKRFFLEDKSKRRLFLSATA